MVIGRASNPPARWGSTASRKRSAAARVRHSTSTDDGCGPPLVHQPPVAGQRGPSSCPCRPRRRTRRRPPAWSTTRRCSAVRSSPSTHLGRLPTGCDGHPRRVQPTGPGAPAPPGARRAVGHDAVDAEVEEAPHLGRRRRSSTRAPAGPARWAAATNRRSTMRIRPLAHRHLDAAGPEGPGRRPVAGRPEAGDGRSAPSTCTPGRRSAGGTGAGGPRRTTPRTPGRGRPPLDDLGQGRHRGVVLGVDVHPHVGPGGEDLLQQGDGLAADPGLATPPTRAARTPARCGR